MPSPEGVGRARRATSAGAVRPKPPRFRDARGRFQRRPASPAASMSGARRSLFVTSEMSDFIKAGGLGEVAAALPRALRRRHDVRVLIPGYPAVLERALGAQIVGRTRAHAGLPACEIALVHQQDGLPVYILLNAALFAREGSPYVSADGMEWDDNAIRFATLSQAAAQIATAEAGLDWAPELLHLNDWPCALAAGYLRWSHSRVPSLLTIHNLAYQGLFPHAMAGALGVPDAARDALDFYGRLSFLQAGIVHADQVNTVSISYARQITGPELGCGLDELLARRAASGRLSGILNGIDASYDPRTDAHLQVPFSINQWQGKNVNAQHVRRAFHLPQSRGPLFAVVSRLVHQKGLDLVVDVAPQIAAAGGQIVFVGQGERPIEDSVRALCARYPAHVAAMIGFEEATARRVYAGSDFLLMPSRFEPCGLSQMYAQRFGSLPIAHATGGLIDTVDDGVTGFLFTEPSADALRRCVGRAFRTWRQPTLLSAMRRAAMLTPSGWDLAGQRYAELYARTAARAA
ncbi:glycogen synthase GlgA [Lysobacteraceae bacterium NML93-0399]|nr:glycogen synthase GlgA [Xanthomonadaceae bacterium NML93-0399]